MSASKANNDCLIYLISPESIELDIFSERLKSAFDGGDIGAFQLRLKNVDKDYILKACEKLIPICHSYGTQFILNDYADMVLESGADGLHIGQEDIALADARKIIGGDKLIGVSCYGSRDFAIDAGEHGADYVAFGAFYDTKTKIPKGRPEPEILSWWSSCSVLPCVAIGGIKPYNCEPIVRAGADFIAVVSYVWEHEISPKAAIEELGEAIKACY